MMRQFIILDPSEFLSGQIRKCIIADEERKVKHFWKILLTRGGKSLLDFNSVKNEGSVWAKHTIYGIELIKSIPSNVFQFFSLLLAFQGQLALTWLVQFCLLNAEYSISVELLYPLQYILSDPNCRLFLLLS